jgi:hypothetical protein
MLRRCCAAFFVIVADDLQKAVRFQLVGNF